MTDDRASRAASETAKASGGVPTLVLAKDHAGMAAVLSTAGIAWFGWAHAGELFEPWLKAGMIASGLALITAIVVSHRIPVPPTLATDARARKVFWLAVVAEFIPIVLGALMLGAIGHGSYLSTWTLFVVGVHFLPLVRPFNAPTLRVTATACVLAAGIALWSGIAGWLPAPTVAGAAGGLVLLASAIAMLVKTARFRSAPTAV